MNNFAIVYVDSWSQIKKKNYCKLCDEHAVYMHTHIHLNIKYIHTYMQQNKKYIYKYNMELTTIVKH